MVAAGTGVGMRSASYPRDRGATRLEGEEMLSREAKRKAYRVKSS